MTTSGRAPKMTELHGVYEKMGELVAEVRSVKHQQQNVSTKLDVIGGMIERMASLEKLVSKHDGEIEELKAAEHRRQGAVGLVEWLSRHWPFTVIAAALAMAWAYLTGRVQ